MDVAEGRRGLCNSLLSGQLRSPCCDLDGPLVFSKAGNHGARRQHTVWLVAGRRDVGKLVGRWCGSGAGGLPGDFGPHENCGGDQDGGGSAGEAGSDGAAASSYSGQDDVFGPLGWIARDQSAAWSSADSCCSVSRSCMSVLFRSDVSGREPAVGFQGLARVCSPRESWLFTVSTEQPI